MDAHRDRKRFIVRAGGKTDCVCGTGIGDSPSRPFCLDELIYFSPDLAPLNESELGEGLPPLGSSPLFDLQFQGNNSAGKERTQEFTV
jgi:hypothetical protein